MLKREKFERIEGVENDTPIPVMIFSFLYSMVFGACCLLPWMALKDLMPLLALALGMPNKRATGAIYISSTVVFAVIFFSLFCVFWYKVEKKFTHKRALKRLLICGGIVLAIGALAMIGVVVLESKKVAA